jgi:hypothetical protein
MCQSESMTTQAPTDAKRTKTKYVPPLINRQSPNRFCLGLPLGQAAFFRRFFALMGTKFPSVIGRRRV